MNRPALLKLGFLLALLLLCAGMAWVGLRLALPRSERMQVGVVRDYVTGQAPLLFWHGSTPFYVLVADGELLALYAVSPRNPRCRIRWEAERQSFIDPCSGARMLPNGAYASGPPVDMQRLPLQVEDGEVWVQIGY